MLDRSVVGTATGQTEHGRLAVIVFLREPISNGSRSTFSLPSAYEGIPVILRVTGEFRAMKGHGGGGTSHTAKQTPPIQLGTSGGWRYDLANGFCCSGTLCSLIHVGTTQYVLSNYHVFWGDRGSSGN